MRPFRVESDRIRVGGERIFYRYARTPGGRSKRPAVLVQGLVVSSRYMVPTIARMARDRDVFAPDLPGFGRSDPPASTLDAEELAEALAHWIDRMALGSAALVGHSFGCNMVAELAIRRPRPGRRLILLGPDTDPEARSVARQVARAVHASMVDPFSYNLIMTRDYLDAGLRRALRTCRYALTHRIETLLPRIEWPALVVRGSRDRLVPRRWAEEATRLLPKGRLKVVPGGGHAINYSMPLEVVRVTRPFLDEAG